VKRLPGKKIRGEAALLFRFLSICIIHGCGAGSKGTRAFLHKIRRSGMGKHGLGRGIDRGHGLRCVEESTG